MAVIEATVSLAETADYNSRRPSVIGNQGSHSMKFSLCKDSPGNLLPQIVDAHGKVRTVAHGK